MIEKATKSQLVTLKNLYDQYKRYSENPYYNVLEAQTMAHPHISDRLYFKAKMKGVSEGRPFSETEYFCVLSDGSQADCLPTNNKKERIAFQKQLIPVRVLGDGSVEKI